MHLVGKKEENQVVTRISRLNTMMSPQENKLFNFSCKIVIFLNIDQDNMHKYFYAIRDSYEDEFFDVYNLKIIKNIEQIENS